MENWKDNNLSAILEYPFDFNRYMEERLREIDDLDERKFMKHLLLDGLGNVIRCTEAKYHQLEQRVYEELELADNQYETVLTIVQRDHYDPTNGTLFPIIEEDIDDRFLETQLSKDGNHWFGSLFLEADEEMQKKFLDKEKFLVKDNQAVFTIQPATRYRYVIEGLYQIFQDNHIPWDTINTGYLDKFYDIYISDEIEITNISLEDINFGEFHDKIRYNRIPLWNIRWVKFGSADFMIPCINGIYFEHEFSLEDKEKKDGYLICSNEDVLEIRHEDKKIVIKSKKETFENWKALHIIQRETILSLDYSAPLLTNRKKDSFMRRFSENSRVHLMTKTDLFRRIMELDIQDFIEVTGYEICENVKDYPNIEGMNWFVRDELFPLESRKVLLLQFKEKKSGYYLNGSIVRFVISQMQLEISEYRCVGVII